MGQKNYTSILKRMLVMLSLIVFTNSFGQYAGTGTFTKITSLAQLTDGYYVITNESDAFLMTNGRSGTATTGYYLSASVSLTSGNIVNPSANNVWKIETNGSGRTIFNEAISKYVGWSSGNAASAEDNPANSNRWTFSYSSSKFTVNNVNTSTRQLSYNNGAPRFAAYDNANQHELQLYKLVETSPTITVGSAISGLDYAQGSGPSVGKPFTLSGSNLTANITLQAPTNFELSTAINGVYSDVLTVNHSSGSVAANTTRYVRLKAGLTATTYSGNITANSTGATQKTIAVSGTVTAPAMTIVANPDVVNFGTVPTGTTSAPQTIAITAQALTGNIALNSEHSGFQISLDGTTWSSQLTLVRTAQNDYSGTIQIRYNATTTGAQSGKVTLNVGGITYEEINFSGTGQCAVLPATPANSFSTSNNPSCGPATLAYTGTAPAGETYYWQTTANDVSIATPITSNQIISTTGSRFVRARNNTTQCWSDAIESPLVTINTAVSITTQPVNRSILVGTTTTFSVVASGSATITYQWQLNNGSEWTDIPTATANSYTTPATTMDMSGYQYRVNVTNSCGTLTSNTATLTVFEPTIVLTSNFSIFTYALGQGPSTNQVFTVSGTNLAQNITINAPTDWELSTNATFTTPLATITLVRNASNAVSNTSIYARLKAGLPQAIYLGTVEAVSTNATTKTAVLNGEVTTAVAFINVEANLGSYPDITNGTNVPVGTQNTLFAARTIGTSEAKSYRIQNLGGAVLNLSGLTITGANATDFSVTTPPPSTVAPGATVTFEVTFSPTAIGERNAIVNIPNNSSNINLFAFNIRGTGNNAIIGVSGNAIAINNGSTTISTTNNTLIGNANANTTQPTTESKPFTISNTGNVALSVTNITVSDAVNFSVSPTTATVAAGASATFTVTFNPASMGIKNATVSITNNDVTANANPFTFAVQGNATHYIPCAAGEEIIYETGFEEAEFTTQTNYQQTVFDGPSDKQWKTFYGTPTTTTPALSGSKWIQMRLYSNGNIGYTQTEFDLSNVTKVEFRGKSANAELDLMVSYSIDGGNTFINPEIFDITPNTATYNNPPVLTYVVSPTGEHPNVRIRFTVSGTAPNSGNKAISLDDIVIYGGISNTKTWNGTAWSGDGAPPTASQKAIFAGDYDTAVNGNVTACECEVQAGVTLTVAPKTTPILEERYLSVESEIVNNGTIEVLNNNSLYQTNDFANNTGTGNMIMHRISQPMYRYDLTYWSSPLTEASGYKLGGHPTMSLSPMTMFDKFYKWDHAADPQAWATINVGNEVMVPGRGYAVRAPQNYSTDPSTVQNYTATFIGIPNNGLVEHAVTGGTDKWNLIGNPYPSALDIEKFLLENRNLLEGTVYLWTHNSPLSQYQYTAHDYATFNFTGPVSTKPSASPGSNTNTPTQYVASGQSFFVKGIASGNVVYHNGMREKAHNHTFFRPANTTPVQNWDMTGKHRIWLNIFNTQGAFNQTLVGYMENATNGLDWGYDGERFSGNHVALYSLLDQKELTIQGRALPFNNQDVIPMGYNNTLTGTLQIGIDHVDGIFEGQDIFLEDLTLNVTHNLKDSAYSFNAVPGTFNDRFVLKFVNTNLGTETPEAVANGVLVYNNKGEINIKSTFENIQDVTVYDLLGRAVFESKNNSQKQFSASNIVMNEQVLIVKVTLENGAVVSKKIVY
ncbi:choice-of-anchor D domain-containing protein [Flavobacterium sp. PLA-1-15]|uniref:choice-of-anchor D domain-containing protein n=1 Tax=Flavobacterium sp. PLA-1-15 TaxID=3380533 RepID=UPI003B819C82